MNNTDTLQEEHPIDPTIRRQILNTLHDLEQQHDIEILFACESGSRGWGFASPDSDYDVRFIYAHRLDWYLSVYPERDVIELPIDEVYDVSGWDVRKSLGLLRNGNATLIEWLSSPVVYRANHEFTSKVRAALPQVHRADRAFHHYLQMAKKNFREHLQGEDIKLKKYLYVLRPLLAALWIERNLGPVPMRFQDLVDAVVADESLRMEIDKLIQIKRQAGESEMTKAIPIIHPYLETEIERLLLSQTPQLSYDTDFGVLDKILAETVKTRA